MRRNLLITFVMFAMCTFGMAQTVVFSDNFDNYTAGSYLAQTNPAWTTWNDLPGSAEDGVISNAQAASAPKSIFVCFNGLFWMICAGSKIFGLLKACSPN